MNKSLLEKSLKSLGGIQTQFGFGYGFQTRGRFCFSSVKAESLHVQTKEHGVEHGSDHHDDHSGHGGHGPGIKTPENKDFYDYKTKHQANRLYADINKTLTKSLFSFPINLLPKKRDL